MGGPWYGIVGLRGSFSAQRPVGAGVRSVVMFWFCVYFGEFFTVVSVLTASIPVAHSVVTSSAGRRVL